jgi:hypothetical protein
MKDALALVASDLCVPVLTQQSSQVLMPLPNAEYKHPLGAASILFMLLNSAPELCFCTSKPLCHKHPLGEAVVVGVLCSLLARLRACLSHGTK